MASDRRAATAFGDLQIVERAVAGDASAFESIFLHFQTPICTYLTRLTGDRELAYDLTQDTFIKAYQAMPRLDPAELSLSAWLYRIATNTALDAIRRRKLIRWLPLFGTRENDEGETTEILYEPAIASFEGALVERDVVARTLAKMPKDYAACLLLHDREGFSTEDLAAMLNLSRSAIRTRLFRARQLFRKTYAELGGHDSEHASPRHGGTV